jgi:hypothetical protein
LFYLLILINWVVLLYLSKNVFFNTGLVLFYLYLILTGIFSYFTKTNYISTFLSQFIGIYFISLYFYNFFIFFKNDYYKIINDYVFLCFILVFIGLPYFIFITISGKIEGYHSIFTEPAHFAIFILPALFYSYKNLFFPRYIFKTLFISILFSASSLAIIGIGFAIFFNPLKLKPFKIIISIFTILFFFTFLFIFYENFNLRIKDTATGIQNNDVTGINLSSYAFVSNIFITQKSLSNNILLGSGLGSHEITHSKFLPQITGTDDFLELKNLNSKDANSLFLRILSDLGLIGALLTFIFLYKHYYTGENNNKIYLSRAILLYIFCKLIRDGHYFPPEFYFFIFAFYFLQKNNNKEIALSI